MNAYNEIGIVIYSGGIRRDTMLLKAPIGFKPPDETLNKTDEVIQENSIENTMVTITLPVIKEHKITIQGVPDLNGDGIIDFKDVILLIKKILEIEEDN